jgi:hypothetical protein
MRRMSRVRRCGVSLAMIMAGSFGLVACSGGGSVQTLDGASGTAVAAAPTAGVSTRAASAVLPAGVTAELVLRAYQGFWTAQVKALNSGQIPGSGLQTYATGAALSGVDANAFRLSQAGMRMSGQPLRSPKVTAIGPVAAASGVQTATLDDCLDVSGWHQIDSTTHQLRDPATRLSRYRVVVTARTVGGVWMISAVQNRTDQTC